MKKIFSFLFISLLSFSISGQTSLQRGIWRATLSLNDSIQMPFNFEVKEKTIDIINAGEKISVDEISYSGDSVFMHMPVFDSEIRAKISDGNLVGFFYNHTRKDKNIIPFSADRRKFRFREFPIQPQFNMSGRWQVRFASDEPPLDISVGEFYQNENYLAGTFLTPTGDYRYLEGEVSGSSFSLSCFDGSHAFLFTGFYLNDGTLSGQYYSGMHFHDTWKATRNKNAALPNPDSLTFLKSGFTKLIFSFPDADSNMVSLSDKKFENKVVIVQVMGSWCPNCMDETAFLAPFYNKYQSKGLEIIGLDYERITEFSRVKNNLSRLKKRYNIDYSLLFAGSTDTEAKNKSLPMLNKIISFPTTIFIDKKGKVRKIHTGFSGPATGMHYEKWTAEITGFVEKLLTE